MSDDHIWPRAPWSGSVHVDETCQFLQVTHVFDNGTDYRFFKRVKKATNKHNAKLQQADHGTKDTG